MQELLINLRTSRCTVGSDNDDQNGQTEFQRFRHCELRAGCIVVEEMVLDGSESQD